LGILSRMTMKTLIEMLISRATSKALPAVVSDSKIISYISRCQGGAEEGGLKTVINYLIEWITGRTGALSGYVRI
jgi:hypothetical protein